MNSVRLVNSKQRCGQQLLYAGSVQHCDPINQWLWPWNLKHRHCCVFSTLIDHCLCNQFSRLDIRGSTRMRYTNLLLVYFLLFSGKLFSLLRDLCCRPVQSWQCVTFYDPSVNWSLTHDPWLTTTHSMTFAYGKEVSMRFRFHTVPTPSPYGAQ